MVRVLLADSQPLFNEALEALFSRDDAHQVVGRCSWAEDAFAHVSSLRPDLVLVDADLLLGRHPLGRRRRRRQDLRGQRRRPCIVVVPVALPLAELDDRLAPAEALGA